MKYLFSFAFSMLILITFSDVRAQDCGPLYFGDIVPLTNGDYAIDVFLTESLIIDDVNIEVEFPSFSSVVVDYIQTTTHPGINTSSSSTATNVVFVGSPSTALQNDFLANIVFSLPFGNCFTGIEFDQANYLTLPSGGCGTVSSIDMTEEFCTPQRMIGGLLETPINGYTITGADVFAEIENGSIFSFLDLTGAYYNVAVPESNLDVTSDRQNHWGCGVSKYDFIAIRRHLLGSVPFTEMAQHIAGDVNNDHRVTTLDMILIQQYLTYNQNPENLFHRNWVFIPTDIYNNLSFPPVLPLTIPTYSESYTVPAGNNDVYGLGFYGIKIGDINETCILDEGRFHETLANGEETLTIPSLQLKKGEEVSIPFTSKDFGDKDVLSIKLNINTEDIEILDLYSTQLPFFDEQATYISRDQKQIEILWFPRTAADFTYDANEPVFNLTVKAKNDINSIFGVITLDSSSDNISMTKSGEIQNVVLDLGNESLPLSAKASVSPNPFNSFVEINIDSPTQQRGVQQLIDIKGKVVFEEPILLNPGNNTLKINALGALPSGLYIQQILTTDYTITNKLIKQ